MDEATARKPVHGEPKVPSLTGAVLAVNACAEVLKLRVGTAIGAAMTREALSLAGTVLEAFGREEIRSFATRLADSASIFLDDDEIEDLRQALDQAIARYIGDR